MEVVVDISVGWTSFKKISISFKFLILLRNWVGFLFFRNSIEIFMKDIKFLFSNQNSKLTLLDTIEKKYSKWFSQLG